MQFIRAQRAFDLAVVKIGSPVPMPHRLVWQFSVTVKIRSKRCAESHSIIRGRGLHKHSFYEAGCRNFPIGFRIQRHTSCKTNVAAPRFLDGHSHHVHHHRFTGVLHGVSDVLMPFVNVALRNTGWT